MASISFHVTRDSWSVCTHPLPCVCNALCSTQLLRSVFTKLTAEKEELLRPRARNRLLGSVAAI